MIRTRLLAIAATALLILTPAAQANQAEVPGAKPAVARPDATNPFDPTYWMTAFTPVPDANTPGVISTELKFNAASPVDWVKWVDPRTHLPMHMSFMNPSTYAQFLQPQFYMEFMKPQNMAAWMNPASYQVMMDPQTMIYWMNPGSYMHVMNPEMYRESMNPANYMVFMNPATYAGWGGSQTCPQNNPNKTPSWFGNC